MAMFFLAFFHQFIHPAHGSTAGQIVGLGAVFWVIGVIWDFGIPWTSGSIGARLHNRPRMDAAKLHVEGATHLALARSAAKAEPRLCGGRDPVFC
jgi:threonine/homoserine/homoserine lactone efflux protein